MVWRHIEVCVMPYEIISIIFKIHPGYLIKALKFQNIVINSKASYS